MEAARWTRVQRRTRRDGSFISDGGFKVAGCEISSMGETLMGSACPPDVVKQTAIPGDFAFRPDMGNYVGNTEQRRTFFIAWKIKLLLPSSPDPVLASISMSSYWSFRHAAWSRVTVGISGCDLATWIALEERLNRRDFDLDRRIDRPSLPHDCALRLHRERNESRGSRGLASQFFRLVTGAVLNADSRASN